MKLIKLFFLLFAITLFNGQNIIRIKNIEGGPGEDGKLILALDNKEKVSGFQIKLVLPSDLIVKEKEAKFLGRQTDHVIYPKRMSNTEYLFLSFSSKGENLSGETGDLFEIPIELPLNYVPGQTYDLKFSENILSSSAGQNILVSTANGILTVTQGKTPDLKVSKIVAENPLVPNGKFNLKWRVDNIGKAPANGGWREQISLVSEKNGKKFILANLLANDNLAISSGINRESEIQIPAIIGFDGAVKVEVTLIPNIALKEPDNLKANNTDLSAITNLNKRLTLSIDRKEIIENSKDKIRLSYSRSGDNSILENFEIASEGNAFGLPTTVKLSQNESSNFLYLSPVDNSTYEGDRKITFTIKGNGYSEETSSILLLDDEKVILTLDYPASSGIKIGDKIPFTLSANFSKNADHKILLSTDKSKRLKLPSEVILKAGAKTATFEGEVLDPQIVEKAEKIYVFAKATGYESANKEVDLPGVNIPVFSLDINPSTISEGDGGRATYGVLKRTGAIDKQVTVSISADKQGQLILPTLIPFEAGETEKRFNIGAVDNGVVDGNRKVVVISTIRFSSCNCTEQNPAYSVKKELQIIDNDGLSISLQPKPSTVKAGSQNNTLRISRNAEEASVLQKEIVVKLTNDKPSIVQLPATVTIPAGIKEKEITYSTKIDTSISGDQSIRIQAEAEGYSSGFGWILVTDQNKPDAAITKIITGTPLKPGEKNSVSTSIQNQGNDVFPSGSKIEYYLTKTNDLSNAQPFATSILNSSIQKGEVHTLKEDVAFPFISGNQQLTVFINQSKVFSELSFDNNSASIPLSIPPSYTVEVATDKKIYVPKEEIKISGITKNSGALPVPNADIEIKIKNGTYTRTFNSKTNSSGAFVYSFVPLANENGSYTVSAAYPGSEGASEAQFQILGFEIVGKPQYIKWEPLVGISLGKEFVLKNNSSTKLTDVKIQIADNLDFKIEQSPITIEAGGTSKLSFNITSLKASVENKFTEIPFKIISTEGAVLNEIAYYHSKAPQGMLTATPISISTTMVKGQTRLYEFTVKNTGMANAEQVEVKLPSLDWLKLYSQEKIEKIAPGEETKVVLQLSPTVKEQINVPINGNLVLTQKNGSSLSVPFRIETVSEATGKLIVDAVDEYYYNTAQAPHLKGAKVTLKHPFTGEVIAQGITNDQGLFEVPTLKEGWYTLSITADKHNPYQNNIQIDPGRTNSVLAFLPYQAISYSWDVTPKDIKDQYDINLTVDFETNIPKPVIVMQIDNPKLSLKSGESIMTNITVTNHGLIAAKRVSIKVGEMSGYTFKPLIDYLDVLNAKSTVIVPVLVTKTNGRAEASAGNACSGPVTLEAYYPCGKDEKMFSHTFYINSDCTGSTPPSIPIGSYGPGYVGGNGGGYTDGPSGTVSEIKPLDLCDPCTKKVLTTLLKCLPHTVVIDIAFCALEIATLKNIKGVMKVVKTCAKIGKKQVKKVKCLKYIPETIWTCIKGFIKGKNTMSGEYESLAKSNVEKGKWNYIYDDFNKLDLAQDAMFARINQYVNNPTIEDDGEKLYLILEEFNDYFTDVKSINAANAEIIKSNLAASGISVNDIDAIIRRWNNTLVAWNNGVSSPNAAYPNIVDKQKLESYDKLADELSQHLTKRGFLSVQDMYSQNMLEMDKYQKELEKENPSVCASVKLEFPQKLTMTREAFEGALKINNSSSKTISNVEIDLIITDALGNNKTSLFQINKNELLNGTSNVSPNSIFTGLVTFVPTKEAAPQVATTYNFGGKFSYYDPEIKERVYVTMNPVSLQVNPSPDLVLRYFMQRDILGDDSLTEDVVEPTIPAELALLISNEGFGAARDVKVESMQPKIVDNQKGLAIDFKIIGSNFNNLPKQLGLMNVDFGNIAPKTSSVGQWWFTSSLMGHFIKYNVKVNHASSFGNDKLSLIKAAYIHELIRSVRAYGTGADEISDFLVNDVADAQDTPDRIYLSQGGSEEVLKAESVEASSSPSTGALAVKVTIKPYSTGWNYGNIMDPGKGQYKLVKVIRDKDQIEIPLQNFWQTHVTLRDGLNPKYENKLHVLDKISEVHTYTLHYKPIDGNIPQVIKFEDVPLANSPKAVEFIKVKFNKEIDVNTFKSANIELIHQGKKIPTDNILIGKIDATTYSLGIKEFTKSSGFYELTVNTLGIKDLLGNEGRDGKKISWIQFINELGILTFKSDQIKKQSLNSITVVFNKKIRSEEFTNDKILINNNLSPNIKIAKKDDYTYTISGIEEYNKVDGNYVLLVKLPKLTAEDGTKGAVDQTFDWQVDKVAPKVANITAQKQGAVHAQNVTDLEIVLNRKVLSGMELENLTLMRDGKAIKNTAIKLEKVDDKTYKLMHLGAFTIDNGKYSFTVDQSSLKDENENLGSGKFNFNWEVNAQKIVAVNNLKLTPDLGSSAIDNITSGKDVKISYQTLLNNLKVKVYQIQATSLQLLEEKTISEAGTYTTSLAGKSGSLHLKVVAEDKDGNESEPAYLKGYIDNTDFTSKIEAVKLSNDDCSGYNYAEVTFSDALSQNTALKDALNIKASGVVIPKEGVSVNKISDLKYRIENIPNDLKEIISIEVDRTKLAKNLTGLPGIGTETKQIGHFGSTLISVSGEEKVKIGETHTYTAKENMNKYDWIAINGEIIKIENNKVTVKWYKKGTQSLVLKYLSPLNCSTTIVKNIEVLEQGVLATGDSTKKPITIAPVPNDGIFTIFTGKTLKDCNIMIYDITGKLIHKESNVAINQSYQVNIKHKASGIYILVLQNPYEVYNFRFIVK